MAEKIFRFRQANCYTITFWLKDEDGDRIYKAALGTLNLTLYYYNPDIGSSDRYHLATINSRYYQDVYDANDVTISTSGTIVWDVQADDNDKLDNSTEEELHVALFKWGWDGKSNSEEIYLNVEKVNYA